MKLQSIINYIFEQGQLQHIRHSGYHLLGVHNPKTVAEHTIRAAQIGYFLALLENYPNPYEVVTMLVFHESGESRIGDINRVANRYLQDVKEAEMKAVKDQMHPFQKQGEKIIHLLEQVEKESTPAGTIAKDADRLEVAFTSKELLEQGFVYAKDWIINIEKQLKTTSAKNVIKLLKESDSNSWWQGLKKHSPKCTELLKKS